MAAITGNYAPASRYVNQLLGRWVVSRANIEDAAASRSLLRNHLSAIRQMHGNAEVRRFRDYLLWVGSYPSIYRGR